MLLLIDAWIVIHPPKKALCHFASIRIGTQDGLFLVKSFCVHKVYKPGTLFVLFSSSSPHLIPYTILNMTVVTATPIAIPTNSTSQCYTIGSNTSSSSSSSNTMTKKRKRSSSLHVRFCTEAPRVEYTYSQSDYDRSGLFPTITPDTQPSVSSPAPPPQSTKPSMILAVSFSVVAHNDEKKGAEQAIPPTKRNKAQRRPRLTIDTSSIHGPLFFTNMTTNHKKPAVIEDNEDVIDQQTLENTRRNR